MKKSELDKLYEEIDRGVSQELAIIWKAIMVLGGIVIGLLILFFIL